MSSQNCCILQTSRLEVSWEVTLLIPIAGVKPYGKRRWVKYKRSNVILGTTSGTWCYRWLGMSSRAQMLNRSAWFLNSFAACNGRRYSKSSPNTCSSAYLSNWLHKFSRYWHRFSCWSMIRYMKNRILREGTQTFQSSYIQDPLLIIF